MRGPRADHVFSPGAEPGEMQTRNSEQGSQQSEGAKTTRSSLELSYLAAIACHGPTTVPQRATTVAARSPNGCRANAWSSRPLATWRRRGKPTEWLFSCGRLPPMSTARAKRTSNGRSVGVLVGWDVERNENGSVGVLLCVELQKNPVFLQVV